MNLIQLIVLETTRVTMNLNENAALQHMNTQNNDMYKYFGVIWHLFKNSMLKDNDLSEYTLLISQRYHTD